MQHKPNNKKNQPKTDVNEGEERNAQQVASVDQLDPEQGREQQRRQQQGLEEQARDRMAQGQYENRGQERDDLNKRGK